MGVLETFARKLEELEQAINPTIKETIERSKPLLIDEQTNVQLYAKGQDSFGSPIQPEYALSTQLIKKKKGQPSTRVTLNDTGDLYESIQIEANATQMIITANVEYFKYLVTKYDTNQILGLQEPFLEEYIKQLILPNLKRSWDNIIKT